MKHSNPLPESNKMTIVRIAPVCNGKIYVIPRPTDGNKTLTDLPIEETVAQHPPQPGRRTYKIPDKYNQHIQTAESPRFCVKYQSPRQRDTVYLYVLPLQEEEEIRFPDGKFVEAKDIASNSQSYTPNLQEEADFLGMAAELWNDYLKGTVPA